MDRYTAGALSPTGGPALKRMRIAALYDIHGNAPALESVLADVEESGVDLIVIGGDVVPGPMPEETLDLLSGLQVPLAFIRGNGETDVLVYRSGDIPVRVPEAHREIVRWTADQLSVAQEERIAAWPLTHRARLENVGDILFCHATPVSDNDIVTRNTAEAALRDVFEGPGAAIVVCGHTHMQFDRQIGETRVINAGSVGMPFGATGAYWLLLGPGGPALRRTEYDLAAAAARVRSSAYPDTAGFADQVLSPRPESEMLALFDSVALDTKGT